MDNLTKNRISNIMYRYGIEENMNNFNKIAEHINGKQIDLYKVIFSILENCIIVDENDHSLKIEICSEEYRHSLDDLSKTFFFKIFCNFKKGCFAKKSRLHVEFIFYNSCI